MRRRMAIRIYTDFKLITTVSFILRKVKHSFRENRRIYRVDLIMIEK